MVFFSIIVSQCKQQQPPRSLTPQALLEEGEKNGLVAARSFIYIGPLCMELILISISHPLLALICLAGLTLDERNLLLTFGSMKFSLTGCQRNGFCQKWLFNFFELQYLIG